MPIYFKDLPLKKSDELAVSHPILDRSRAIVLMSGDEPKYPSSDFPSPSTDKLAEELKRHGVEFEVTRGKYEKPERSVIAYDMDRGLADQLARKYGQESYVHIEPNGMAKLHYVNGIYKTHDKDPGIPQDGKHRPESGSPKVVDLEPEDNYTYVPSINKFVTLGFDWSPEGLKSDGEKVMKNEKLNKSEYKTDVKDKQTGKMVHISTTKWPPGSSSYETAVFDESGKDLHAFNHKEGGFGHDKVVAHFKYGHPIDFIKSEYTVAEAKAEIAKVLKKYESAFAELRKEEESKKPTQEVPAKFKQQYEAPKKLGKEELDKKSPPGHERQVEHIAESYEKKGKSPGQAKAIAAATAWKEHGEESKGHKHAEPAKKAETCSKCGKAECACKGESCKKCGEMTKAGEMCAKCGEMSVGKNEAVSMMEKKGDKSAKGPQETPDKTKEVEASGSGGDVAKGKLGKAEEDIAMLFELESLVKSKQGPTKTIPRSPVKGSGKEAGYHGPTPGNVRRDARAEISESLPPYHGHGIASPTKPTKIPFGKAEEDIKTLAEIDELAKAGNFGRTAAALLAVPAMIGAGTYAASRTAEKAKEAADAAIHGRAGSSAMSTPRTGAELERLKAKRKAPPHVGVWTKKEMSSEESSEKSEETSSPERSSHEETPASEESKTKKSVHNIK